MKDMSTEAESYILFELAGTTYAIPSQLVKQMEMVERITPVPNALPCVEGVVFSRGQVIPAINLRLRFGFEKVPYDLRTRLIVIQTHDRTVGLIADTAREFVRLPRQAIQLPPEAIADAREKYLIGITTIGDRIVLILNVDELLNFTTTTVPQATVSQVPVSQTTLPPTPGTTVSANGVADVIRSKF